MHTRTTLAKSTRALCAFALIAGLLALAACSSSDVGPSEEIVRKDIDDGEKALAQMFGYRLDSYQVTEILRGEALESRGTREIPAGTILYPIKYTIERKFSADSSPSIPAHAEVEVFFFQDSYGKWTSKPKQAL